MRFQQGHNTTKPETIEADIFKRLERRHLDPKFKRKFELIEKNVYIDLDGEEGE